jgi:colanic acid biosynthesis glycosyl transferase WcaI
MLHEAGFVATSLLRALLLPKADVLVIVSPPLLLGAAGSLLSALWRRPYIFHVQDLQPDAALRLGMLGPGALTRLLYRLENHAYRRAARVSGISAGMIASFRQKGVSAEKCILFPNGVELRELPRRAAFRERHGFAGDDFLVVYSGNLGAKQGLDVLIAAARLLRHPRIRIVLCGDGADHERLRQMAADTARVHFLPLLPEADYWELMANADIAVIPQVSGSGGAFFPSKLLSAAVAGRPVLSIADEESELARAVQESGCGRNVLPGDAAQIAAVLDSLPEDAAALRAYGEAGRRWVERFEFGQVLAAFTAELERVSSVT